MSAVFEPVSLEAILLEFYPRDYSSASAAKMVARCDEQARRRYVLGHKAPPNANMVWGGADHAAVGWNYAQKVETEKDLPVSEVEEFFANDVDERVEENGGPSEIEWSGREYEDKTPAQAHAIVKDKGTALVAAYQQTVAPTIFPTAVEEEFLLELDGLPPIKGYIDVIAQRRVATDMLTIDGSPIYGGDLAPFVIERKTKRDSRPPGGDDRFQAHLYELATGLQVEFQMSIKTGEPRVQILEREPLQPPARTLALARQLVLRFATNYALYGPDQPWPGTGKLHPFACSYCGFRETCPHWNEDYWPK